MRKLLSIALLFLVTYSFAQDEGYKAPPGCHISSEQRRLTDGKIRPSHRRKRPGQEDGRVPYSRDADAGGIGRFRVLANGTHPQSEGRTIEHIPSHRN